MKIVVLGAGQVGHALVQALHEDHDVTVIDLNTERLSELSDRYDVRVVEGNGTTRRVICQAGVETADLLFACSPREEVNLVCAMLVKRLSNARAIVRTTSVEYLEAWRERQIDVDFMISSELETANVISEVVGCPAARQTDVFADGRVQVVEFDVPRDAANPALIGLPLRRAQLPQDSKVASIIRGDEVLVPRGGEAIRPGDRIVVIGSPAAARAWSRVMAPDHRRVDDVTIFGAGRMGETIGRVLLDRGIRVRLVDAQLARAREVAHALPHARVFHADGFDPEFLERERIGGSAAAIFCMNDDAKNLYGSGMSKVHGVRFTVALMHDRAAGPVYEHGGVDVAIDPRQVVAEELVRFAHDPRIQQIAMLEGNRFEILDITVRPESALAGKAFDELPSTGTLIGAIVRDGSAIFPRGSDVLRPGDRVIVFVESRRAAEVERAL